MLLECIISFFDEAAIFLGMLGRYNGGAAYDRGIILNLFNAPTYFNRDLKGHKTRLENPTFNMVMCGHPGEFGEFVRSEHSENPDGLSLRILYNMPKPLFDMSFRAIKNIKKPDMSIINILYAVECINKHNVEFRYDEEADHLFCDYVNLYRRMIQKSHTIVSYIS
jgi:hypothetical protein